MSTTDLCRLRDAVVLASRRNVFSLASSVPFSGVAQLLDLSVERCGGSRLFMKADEAGDRAEARKVIALMAKIDGMEVIPKETGVTPQEDDFDNRTENELEFYGDHGHWPEDDAVAGDPEEPKVH